MKGDKKIKLKPLVDFMDKWISVRTAIGVGKFYKDDENLLFDAWDAIVKTLEINGYNTTRRTPKG